MPRLGFLEQPPPALRDLWTTADSEQEVEGRLGPYRLLRRIGDGGMGVDLFLAQRVDQFEQHVAIKRVRREIATPTLVERLRVERQILAGLEHPCIARLLDGGADARGFPYLVMEWIQGVPITEYCDRERLNVEERLRLLLVVCDAVSYAHQPAHRAPGPQATQHPGDRGRPAEAVGLRHRQVDFDDWRWGRHFGCRAPVHAELRRPRTDRGQAGIDRQRRLLSGCRTLRAALWSLAAPARWPDARRSLAPDRGVAPLGAQRRSRPGGTGASQRRGDRRRCRAARRGRSEGVTTRCPAASPGRGSRRDLPESAAI